MDKKCYIAPAVEVMELECGDVLLGLSTDGIKWGGNASECNVDEADVNMNDDWGIW